MSTNLDCFQYAIGLSRTNCNCYTDEIPTDASLSESNLFLDEIQGLNLIYPASAADCSKGNIWELMELARTEGIMQHRMDVMAYINKRAVRKRSIFSGVIGDDRTDGVKESINKTFAGLTWKTVNAKGAFMRIKRISAYFDSSTPFNSILYGNQSNTPLATWTLEPVANQVTWFTLPQPFDLELFNGMPYNPQFWLVYQSAAAGNPVKTKVHCGCGELSKVNVWSSQAKFQNLSIPQARYNWLDWMVLTGTKGDLITKRDDDWTHENLSHGLMIDAEFICNANEILCNGSLDFTNDEVAMAQAYAIRFQAGARLCDLILSSPKLNRYTMLDREALYGKRSHFKKEADQYAQWIAQELTSPERINSINDCFSCRNTHGFHKAGIKITD